MKRQYDNMLFSVYIFNGYKIVEIFQTKDLYDAIDKMDEINDKEDKTQVAVWRIESGKEPYETIRNNK